MQFAPAHTAGTTTSHGPMTLALALGAATADTGGLAARFAVRQLIEEVADAVRSGDLGERRFHLCRAKAMGLTLSALLRRAAATPALAALDDLRRALDGFGGDITPAADAAPRLAA